MIQFWTDPHLGLTRYSHTTPASRDRLRNALLLQVRKKVLWPLSHHSYCLGDLFDRFSNPEPIILDAANALRDSHVPLTIMAGNHDHSNVAGAVSSLRLIDRVADIPLTNVWDEADTPRCSWYEPVEGLAVVGVPHKLSQGLFEQALTDAEGAALEMEWPGYKTCLLLHCNYNSPFADREDTLNLTEERAKRLLEHFDYVLLGHEHMPATHLDGRLIILGNTHPTSLSDVSDKYMWWYKEGEFSREQIWKAEGNYVEISADELVSGYVMREPAQFVKIVGNLPAAHMPELARAVQRLWQVLPEAFVIANQAVAIDTVTVSTMTSATRAMDVPTRISEELRGSPLEAAWEGYRQRATA